MERVEVSRNKIDSPCIDVCTLSAEGFCIGCWRHIDEIVRWAALSADERTRIMADLERRRCTVTELNSEVL